jgi:hypothetical protein
MELTGFTGCTDHSGLIIPVPLFDIPPLLGFAGWQPWVALRLLKYMVT